MFGNYDAWKLATPPEYEGIESEDPFCEHCGNTGYVGDDHCPACYEPIEIEDLDEMAGDEPEAVLMNEPTRLDPSWQTLASLNIELSQLRREIERLRAENESLRADKADFAATIKRVWSALGIETYEQAGGKEISELVADLRARAEPSR